VDLGSEQDLGSVWLWGVDDERVVVRPEVQTITLYAGEWFEQWVQQGE
jgi:hypothetical protein